MAKIPEASTKPWILEMVPLLIFVLVTVHVLALAYWFYRLVTDKLPQRTKAN